MSAVCDFLRACEPPAQGEVVARELDGAEEKTSEPQNSKERNGSAGEGGSLLAGGLDLYREFRQEHEEREGEEEEQAP